MSKDSLIDEISLSHLFISRKMFFMVESSDYFHGAPRAVCFWALHEARKLHCSGSITASKKLMIFFRSLLVFVRMRLGRSFYTIPLFSGAFGQLV